MIWVKFSSLVAFDAWHNTIKSLLGLPKISTDAEGNPVPEATITTDYVLPIVVSNDDVRALIDDVYLQEDDPLRFDIEISENPYPSNYDS